MAWHNEISKTRTTHSDKILPDKAFNIGKNSKYDGYERGVALMVYRCFDSKTSVSVIKNGNTLNKELAEELHNSIIRKF